MLAKIKYLIAAVVLGLGLVGMATVPAAANAKEDLCAGITAGGGNCTEDGSSLTKVIRVVIQILSLVAGVAAIIMIIVGGLRYITSGGDASKVASAKNAIIYAIIGLVVVVFSQFIVRFVLEKTTT